MSDLTAALAQAWPPFVLILGLLLVGLVAHREGLFAWGGSRLRRVPGGAAVLLAAALALVGLVTAVLNLDTAVVFLTPVLIVAARERRLAVEPFLYGCVFMANASSLFLPGSNLTNLLVLHGGATSGSEFAARMLPLAATAAAVTAVGVLALFRRQLGPARAPKAAVASAGTGEATCEPTIAGGATPVTAEAAQTTAGVGLLATALVTASVLAFPQPALPVLAVGLTAAWIELARGRLTLAEVLRVVGPASLLAAFALTVLLGTLARGWAAPNHLLAGASGWQTAGIAALSAVAINNLPAAALYSAHAVEHSRMLLLGLDVGPNLAVTGALSALLWHRAATQAGARPSLLAFSRYGVVLTIATFAAAFLAGYG